MFIHKVVHSLLLTELLSILLIVFYVCRVMDVLFPSSLFEQLPVVDQVTSLDSAVVGSVEVGRVRPDGCLRHLSCDLLSSY